MYCGPVGPVDPETGLSLDDPLLALLPEDREWLREHGWREREVPFMEQYGNPALISEEPGAPWWAMPAVLLGMVVPPVIAYWPW